MTRRSAASVRGDRVKPPCSFRAPRVAHVPPLRYPEPSPSRTPMPDRPQYWTPEFVEAFVEAMNEDASFQKAVRGFSDTIVLRCLDHPTGQDVEASYTFEDGEVTGAELWMED